MWTVECCMSSKVIIGLSFHKRKWQLKSVVSHGPARRWRAVPEPDELRQRWTACETWVHWSAPVYPELLTSPSHPLPAQPHPITAAIQCKAFCSVETQTNINNDRQTQQKNLFLLWKFSVGSLQTLSLKILVKDEVTLSGNQIKRKVSLLDWIIFDKVTGGFTLLPD